MRKVIQTSIGEKEGRLYTIALCDDGSMWLGFTPNTAMTWQRLPDVPQSEGEEIPSRVSILEVL